MVERLSRREVQAILQVDEGFLLELEREMIVRTEEGLYTSAEVERARICRTLRDELELNLPGIEVALQLLDRIAAERRQFQEVLAWLRAQLEKEG